MEKIRELRFGEFLFTTDRGKLDLSFIHAYLTTSYWSPGISRTQVKTAMDNSISIGIYKGTQQIGFARILTDYSTFAYLADVFVDPSCRGLGLSKKMMEWIFTFEFVGGLRRFILATRDAHGLYEQFGFVPIQRPDRFMEIHQQDVYLRN